MIHQLILTMQQAFESIQSGLDLGDLFDLTAGGFAFVLGVLSLNAWASRRQPAFLMVSIGFFLFFAKTIIEVLPVEGPPFDSVGFVLDFAFLALFFFAIVLRPKRR